jgi:uncharacterized protein involved in exopolysaccharide biosynthesis
MSTPNPPTFIELTVRILNACAKRKKFLTLWVLIPAVLVVILTDKHIWKPTFASDALIMPPTSSQVSGGLTALLGGETSMLSGLLGTDLFSNNELNIVWSLINTKNLHDKAIEKFNLKEHYEFDSDFYADILKEFRSNLVFDLNDENMIEIRFEDKKPQMAYDILSFLIANVDSMYAELKVDEASFTQKFFEARLKETDEKLKKIQKEFGEFQVSNNMYNPEIQLEATVTALADLESKRDILGIERDFESRTRSDKSPLYQTLSQKLTSMNSAIHNLQSNKRDNSVLLSLKRIPPMATEYFEFERELKIESAIYKYLRQRYEELNLETVKKGRNLVIIQEPWVNDKKVAPPRMAVCALVLFLAMVSGVLICNLREYLQNEIDEGTEFSLIYQSLIKNLRFKS